MKKNIISLAIASCFVFGASLAQAQPAVTQAMKAKSATPFTGQGLNTPWNCCEQYLGQSGERDQPGELNAPGEKINNQQSQAFDIDPGYKNDSGQRMPYFRLAGAVVNNNEPTDVAMYGAGRDAANTGDSMGTGDTLGQKHFTPKSGFKQWIKR